jgi:hypothetical protein
MPSTFYLIFHHFAQLAVRDLPDNLETYLELRPLQFSPSGRQTWGLSLHLRALGADQGAARAFSERGLQLFVDLLQSVRPAKSG